MESSSRSKIREIENDSGRLAGREGIKPALIGGGLVDDGHKEIADDRFNGTCLRLSLREAILKELLVHN